MGNGNQDTALVTQDQLQSMLAMAERIVKSGLAPKGIDTADKALVVILQGRELGMGVMQSLQDLYVVQGKVGMMTGNMAARYLDAGHRYFILEKSADKCSVKFVLSSGQEYVETITYAEAHESRWDQQWNKEKGAWEPKATWAGRGRATMLLNRTLSAGIRSVAPGALRGALSVDEVTDANYEVVEPDGDERVERMQARIEELERANRALKETVFASGPVNGAGGPVQDGVHKPWLAEGADYDGWTNKPAERDIFAKFRDEYGLSDADAKRLAGRAMGGEPLQYFRVFPGDRLRLQAAILYMLDLEVEDAAEKLEAEEGETE